MKRLFTLLSIATLVGAVSVPTVALAAPNGPGASGWKVGYYTPSGRALSVADVAPASDGLATLNFTNQDNTALLITTHGSSPLLGNDLGKTIEATFTISGADSAFTYYGEAAGSSLPAASVRLFFETSNAGGFAPTEYWWANEASATLANGTFTIAATMTPSSIEWGDFYGAGAYSASGFTAAASNVTGIGLSFGGGYFYENGVATTDGSGTLTLSSFTVS